MKKEVLNLGWDDSRRVQGFAALDTEGRPFLFRGWPRKEPLGLQLLTISLLIIPTLILFNLFSRDKSDATLLKMVNEKRVENGLAPVIYNQKLGRSSTRKACDMAKSNYFSHFSPNGKLWEFFTNVDYHYQLAGENLAKDCTDKDCVTLWMRSPKHREIILDPRYKEGTVSRCGEYLALHFGTRLSLKEIMQIMIFKIKAHLK